MPKFYKPTAPLREEDVNSSLILAVAKESRLDSSFVVVGVSFDNSNSYFFYANTQLPSYYSSTTTMSSLEMAISSTIPD